MTDGVAIAGIAVAMMLLGWLASNAVLWWDTGRIAAGQAHKAQLYRVIQGY